jgi:hypothetical protein
VQRLSEPSPRDRQVTRQLAAYKGLAPRWHEWGTVVAACERLADAICRSSVRYGASRGGASRGRSRPTSVTPPHMV